MKYKFTYPKVQIVGQTRGHLGNFEWVCVPRDFKFGPRFKGICPKTDTLVWKKDNFLYPVLESLRNTGSHLVCKRIKTIFLKAILL